MATKKKIQYVVEIESPSEFAQDFFDKCINGTIVAMKTLFAQNYKTSKVSIIKK